MTRSRVIVLDQRGLWTTALTRLLAADHRVRQVSNLRECSAELSTAPASCVAIEVTPGNLLPVLDWLSRLSVSYPRARAIALLDPRVKDQNWVLLESGAALTVTSLEGLRGVDRVVRNHFAQAPPEQRTFAERVWQSLPWARA
jgi:hypothetical protein